MKGTVRTGERAGGKVQSEANMASERRTHHQVAVLIANRPKRNRAIRATEVSGTGSRTLTPRETNELWRQLNDDRMIGRAGRQPYSP